MAEYPPFVKPFQEIYGDIEKDINKKIQGWFKKWALGCVIVHPKRYAYLRNLHV